MTKTKEDNNVTNRTGVVYEKTILNFHNWSDQVWSVMKTRHKNDVTNCMGVIYIENETVISWMIELGVVCE